MRPFGRVAQITPDAVSHHGEDVPIGRQASRQEGALDASQNLGRPGERFQAGLARHSPRRA
jgi:hypothetical protein